MTNAAGGIAYQVSIAFAPNEVDAYFAALVALEGAGGRVAWWGYSCPGSSEPALLNTASPLEGPVVGAWARCLDVAASRWPDRAALGAYVDVSVYESSRPAGADGVSADSNSPLTLREHFVGRRTGDGLAVSFADDDVYLELAMPVDLRLEDVEPGPTALVMQAVCAIEAELSLQRMPSPPPSRTMRRAR